MNVTPWYSSVTSCCYTCLKWWFFWIHTIWGWNGKTSFLSFHDFIFHNPSPIIWLLRLCHLFCFGRDFFIYSNEPLPPLHVSLYWYICRTACFQDMTLVMCWMNSWRTFPSTIYFSLLWFNRKRLPIFLTPDVICLLYLLFLPWNCFKMSRLMDSMSIECNETRISSSSYDILVAKHVTI